MQQTTGLADLLVEQMTRRGISRLLQRLVLSTRRHRYCLYPLYPGFFLE